MLSCLEGSLKADVCLNDECPHRSCRLHLKALLSHANSIIQDIAKPTSNRALDKRRRPVLQHTHNRLLMFRALAHTQDL